MFRSPLAIFLSIPNLRKPIFVLIFQELNTINPISSKGKTMSRQKKIMIILSWDSTFKMISIGKIMRISLLLRILLICFSKPKNSKKVRSFRLRVLPTIRPTNLVIATFWIVKTHNKISCIITPIWLAE